jgi:hypothetical protein
MFELNDEVTKQKNVISSANVTVNINNVRASSLYVKVSGQPQIILSYNEILVLGTKGCDITNFFC